MKPVTDILDDYRIAITVKDGELRMTATPERPSRSDEPDPVEMQRKLGILFGEYLSVQIPCLKGAINPMEARTGDNCFIIIRTYGGSAQVKDETLHEEASRFITDLREATLYQEDKQKSLNNGIEELSRNLYQEQHQLDELEEMLPTRNQRSNLYLPIEEATDTTHDRESTRRQIWDWFNKRLPRDNSKLAERQAMLTWAVDEAEPHWLKRLKGSEENQVFHEHKLWRIRNTLKGKRRLAEDITRIICTLPEPCLEANETILKLAGDIATSVNRASKKEANSQIEELEEKLLNTGIGHNKLERKEIAKHIYERLLDARERNWERGA